MQIISDVLHGVEIMFVKRMRKVNVKTIVTGVVMEHVKKKVEKVVPHALMIADHVKKPQEKKNYKEIFRHKRVKQFQVKKKPQVIINHKFRTLFKTIVKF